MTHTEWRAIIASYDQMIIILFLAVLGFSINWYAWPKARWILAWLAIVVFISLFVANLIWG